MACTILTQDAEPLKPLERLIGVWISTGKTRNELTFRWILGAKFIGTEFVSRADDKIVWADAGVIGYDPDQKRIVSFLFAADGNISRGAAVETQEKDTWILEGSTTGGKGKEWRTTTRWIDADTLTWTLESKKADAWEKVASSEYKRKK